MLLKIADAKYLGNYRIQLKFNDGREGVADLRALSTEPPKSIFAAFADESFVRQYGLEHGTLCWPGERDIAAEYLYFLAFKNEPGLQDLFAKWGYLDKHLSGGHV